MKNPVLQKFRQGKPAVGTFMGLGSASVAELLAEAGLEWLVLETEHNAVDWADVQHMLMAMRASGCVPLIRIPSSDPVYIQKALDIGGMGVVVPLVRTADEARAIVRATRYPPVGARGFGPLRGSSYTVHNAEYFADANDNTLVALIIETREAVDNLEAIMQVPGIDVMYLGPFDLCLSLGLDPMKQPYPQIEEAFQKMLALGRKHKVAIGCNVFDRAQMEQRLGQGVSMVGYGTDYVLLLEGARAGLRAFREFAK